MRIDGKRHGTPGAAEHGDAPPRDRREAARSGPLQSGELTNIILFISLLVIAFTTIGWSTKIRAPSSDEQALRELGLRIREEPGRAPHPAKRVRAFDAGQIMAFRMHIAH